MDDAQKKTNEIRFSRDAACVLFGAWALFLIFGCAFSYQTGFVDGERSQEQLLKISQPPVTPTPAPTPAYPSVVTYTVLSTTTANGDYRIITTNGQILICADIYDYNMHALRDTYTSEVISYSDGKYFIKSPTLIGRHYTDVRDYQDYYDNRYWWPEEGKSPCVGTMICA